MNNERYLFCLDEIPGKNEDRLREFLKKDYCIDWVDNAKIEKIDERSISVSDEKNRLLLSLKEEKNAIYLKIDDIRICELNARSEEGRLNVYRINLIHLIQCKVQLLREYLNNPGRKRPWWLWPKWFFQWLFELLNPKDPVRIKNLEKVIGHLQSILFFLDQPHNTAGNGSVSLISLLQQIKDPEEISPNNAWELSDLFEIEKIRHGDDPYLFMLLKAQNKLDSPHKWYNHFPADYLETLIKRYTCGKFLDCYSRLEARQFLEYLEQVKIEEYRRDRAKTELRGNILFPMTVFLAVFLAGFLYFYYLTRPEDLNFLLLVLFSGALASILSRSIKLINQPLHGDADSKTKEPPLGIRKMMSEYKIFIAQPFIGATAALIVFLVFSAGQIQLAVPEASKSAAYALIAFLAGFSEVYFIGILDKVAGKTGSSLQYE